MSDILEDMRNEAAHEADKATAIRMIKMGKLSIEDVALYVPSLSLDEVKKLQAEIMQLT